jgi:hypothetical protein
MIIRHGEKPGNPSNDKHGGPNLSALGSARAAALSSLFTPDPNAKTVTNLSQLACDVSSTRAGHFSGAYSSSGIAAGDPRFPVPAFLFASQGSSSSNRPVETITPLSVALGLEINSTYPDQCYGDLATAILGAPATYGGKVILIAWHHGHAPDLAHAFGVSKSELKPWSRQLEARRPMIGWITAVPLKLDSADSERGFF